MTSAGRRIVLSAAAILGLAAPAAAQEATRTLPGLDNFRLESPRPAPVPTPTSTPTPTPTSRAIPIPDAPRIVFPTPVASPTPRAARPPERTVTERVPTDRASTDAPTPATRRGADATPPAEPDVVATPVPTPTAAPSAVTTPGAVVPTPAPEPTMVAPVPAAADGDERTIWPWLVAGLVIAGLAAFLLLRRRRHVPVEADVPAPPPRAVPPAVSRKPVPAAVPVPVAATPAEPRARLALTLRPLRAGLNMLSAVVECEVTITNTGAVAAQDVRLDVRLLSAGAGQDADLAAIYAEAPVRPAVPVFTLEPGETRQVKALAALARAAIMPMMAGGRPMFVPIVALVARYRANAATAGQTSQAFAVGIERVDLAKLAPLWLDQPARMHSGVAARPHAAVLES